MKLAVHRCGLRQVVSCIKEAMSPEGFRSHPAVHSTISDSSLSIISAQPSSLYSSSACVIIGPPCLLGQWHTQPKMSIAMDKGQVPTRPRRRCISLPPWGLSCLFLLQLSRTGNRIGPRDGVHTQLCLHVTALYLVSTWTSLTIPRDVSYSCSTLGVWSTPCKSCLSVRNLSIVLTFIVERFLHTTPSRSSVAMI
jgi:hypothetical protein